MYIYICIDVYILYICIHIHIYIYICMNSEILKRLLATQLTISNTRRAQTVTERYRNWVFQGSGRIVSVISTSPLFWFSYGLSHDRFWHISNETQGFDPFPRNEKLCGNLQSKCTLRNWLQKSSYTICTYDIFITVFEQSGWTIQIKGLRFRQVWSMMIWTRTKRNSLAWPWHASNENITNQFSYFQSVFRFDRNLTLFTALLWINFVATKRCDLK